MFNPLTVPPKLILRALDDLSALAEVARQLLATEQDVDRLVTDALKDLKAMRAAVEPLPGLMTDMSGKLDELREGMSPIRELPALRGDIGRLDEGMGTRLDTLIEGMKPIKELPNLRVDIQELGNGMGGKLEDVKDAVDDLEPLLEQVATEIKGLRSEIGPVGDVIDNLPKFMKN